MKDFDINDVKKITDAIIIHMNDYNVSEKTTEIAVRDNSNDKLIEYFIGSILTEGKSKRTAREYMRLIKRFSNEIGKNFTEVLPFDVKRWLALLQNTVSLRSCENYRAYLSSFFSWLFNEGFISKNPIATVNAIKYKDEVRKPFSDIEIDALRSACETLRDRALLEVLLASGARANELSNMNISDVNIMTSEIIITEAKGGKQRKVFLTNIAVYYLKKYLETRTDNDVSLFSSRLNKRLSVSGIERFLKRLGEKAKVDDVHPHRCRRTFATNLAKKGMDMKTIQMLMGHSNINTTMDYITLSTDRIKSEYMRFAQ